MNKPLRIIALSSLALVMLIVGACNLITVPNTDFNFSDLDEAQDWIEEHIWHIRTEVSEAEDKSSMIIHPSTLCYKSGVISLSNDYQLWINDTEIPLEFYGTTSNPRLRVDWDLIHGDLAIPNSDRLHYVFHINGIEKINKIILIPSTPAFEPFDFENVDLSSPVVVSWALHRDADLQALGCQTMYWEGDAGAGHGREYFVETNRRNYTIDIDQILNSYAYWAHEDLTTDNLTIESFSLKVTNFEEDGFNVVSAIKKAVKGSGQFPPWKSIQKTGQPRHTQIHSE